MRVGSKLANWAWISTKTGANKSRMAGPFMRIKIPRRMSAATSMDAKMPRVVPCQGLVILVAICFDLKISGGMMADEKNGVKFGLFLEGQKQGR